MGSSTKPLSMITAIRDYVTKMVTDVSGMKVLVMDAETTGIVSMVYTQTQILQQEVFLIDAIERGRTDKMPHLKAVYCVRPTPENIRLLQEEFKEPRYGEYHLFFTNLTREGQIQQLAQADEHEVVQQVQEFYADFVPINHELFSLNVPSVCGLSGAAWDQGVFDRVHQGVCAALLGLKKRPVVRYQANSEMAMRLAESTLGTMDTEGELFGFRRPDVPPLLLLLDRRDDPVTPLLNQWTYQAMVHELLGINNNRVDISAAPDLPKDIQKEVVLAPEQAHHPPVATPHTHPCRHAAHPYHHAAAPFSPRRSPLVATPHTPIATLSPRRTPHIATPYPPIATPHTPITTPHAAPPLGLLHCRRTPSTSRTCSSTTASSPRTSRT